MTQDEDERSEWRGEAVRAAAEKMDAERKAIDPDDIWVKQQVERLVRSMGEAIILTFNAMHEAEKITFEQFWTNRLRNDRAKFRAAENDKTRVLEQRHQAMLAEVQREVLELWGTNYFLSVGGQKVTEVPRSLAEVIRCGKCKAAIDIHGRFQELYEVHHNDLKNKSPVQIEFYATCSNCKDKVPAILVAIP